MNYRVPTSSHWNLFSKTKWHSHWFWNINSTSKTFLAISASTINITFCMVFGISRNLSLSLTNDSNWRSGYKINSHDESEYMMNQSNFMIRQLIEAWFTIWCHHINSLWLKVDSFLLTLIYMILLLILIV